MTAPDRHPAVTATAEALAAACPTPGQCADTEAECLRQHGVHWLSVGPGGIGEHHITAVEGHPLAIAEIVVPVVMRYFAETLPVCDALCRDVERDRDRLAAELEETRRQLRDANRALRAYDATLAAERAEPPAPPATIAAEPRPGDSGTSGHPPADGGDLNPHRHYELVCPLCGNAVIGTLPGGVPVGPEAVGRGWPKHYQRTVSTGCPHCGPDHPIEAHHVRELAPDERPRFCALCPTTNGDTDAH